MGKLPGALMASLGLLASAPVHSKDREAMVFEPTSAWVVDYAEDFCSLRRAFQVGDTKMRLEIRQYAPGLNYDLYVFGDWKGFESLPVGFRFSDVDEFPKHQKVFVLTFKEGGSGMMGVGRWGPRHSEQDDGEQDQIDPAAILDWAKSVADLTVGSRDEQEAVLKTGSLDGVVKVMIACLDELTEHWGLDVEKHKTLLQPAAPTGQGGWAKRIQDEYPGSALRAEQSGPVNIRVIVDPKGKPKNCRAIASLAARVLNEAACEGFMKYARFKPAIAADGQAIDSYWSTKIIYRIN